MLSSPAAIDLGRPFSTFDIASRRAVIAAVSGGSDSTALLLLLKDHLDRFAPATQLVAVTIDHAMRPGSAAEAADVAKLCADIGVAHSTLIWTGPKPSTGLAAAAREARYRLLAQAADEAETDLLLAGHTADDQAETVLMRGERDDKGRGLAGMAPATLYDGRMWIARPLLKIRREALRNFLRARNIGWIDDPTNDNPAFERPRMRAQLAGEAGRFEAALIDADAAADRRRTLGEAAALLIREHATRPAPGLLRLDPGILDADPAAAIYALRILLATAGGTPHLPDEARTAALYGGLAAKPFRAALSRALVDVRRDGIFLRREARNLPAPVEATDGMVWDGRYRILAPSPGGRVRGRSAPVSRTDDLPAPSSLIRAALAAEPAVGEESRREGVTVTPIIAPWSRFLPSFDLAPARAVANLIGAAEIPQPPFQSHNGGKA